MATRNVWKRQLIISRLSSIRQIRVRYKFRISVHDDLQIGVSKFLNCRTSFLRSMKSPYNLNLAPILTSQDVNQLLPALTKWDIMHCCRYLTITQGFLTIFFLFCGGIVTYICLCGAAKCSLKPHRYFVQLKMPL